MGNAPADPNALVQMGISYYAVFDSKTMCIDEVTMPEALRHARVPPDLGTMGPDLSAPFNADPVLRDLAQLRSLALRFGLRALDGVAFGAAENDYVLENDPYLSATKNGHLADLAVGPAHSPAASPDGSVFAFAACGTPCPGHYPLHLLDAKTRRVRRVDVGDVSSDVFASVRWSAAGDTVFYRFAPTKNGLEHATKSCVGALDVKTLRKKTLTCLPGSGAFAMSPGITTFALGSESSPPGEDALVVFRLAAAASPGALPSATEVFRSPGRAQNVRVDDDSRLMWDDNDGHDFHFRVHIATPRGTEIVENAQLGGSLSDGSLLLWPNDQPSDAMPPLGTLASKGRCGIMRRYAPKGN
jgi:hypothetical protein